MTKGMSDVSVSVALEGVQNIREVLVTVSTYTREDNGKVAALLMIDYNDGSTCAWIHMDETAFVSLKNSIVSACDKYFGDKYPR